MTLQEAVKIAEESRGGKVSIAGDCGDRWVFSFKEDEGCLGGAPVFVFKDDGRCEYFFVTDYIDSLESGEITCAFVELSEVK